jgi:hypothetical protein
MFLITFCCCLEVGGVGIRCLAWRVFSPSRFLELSDDIEPSLALSEEAFGAPLEAVNLWIGDERSDRSATSGRIDRRRAVG